MLACLPSENVHFGILGVVLGESACGGGDSKPERAKRHAPFSTAFDKVGNSVLDFDFRHFSNKELATHTQPPFRESLSRTRKLACGKAPVDTRYPPNWTFNGLETIDFVGVR